MFKIVAGVLVTSGLIGQFVISPMLPSPGQPETEHNIGWETVEAPLKTAESGISDEATARYYRKLMQDYALGTTSNGQEKPMPDFDKISRAAAGLPLQAAGKEIKDKDIANFYNELLNSTGVNGK